LSQFIKKIFDLFLFTSLFVACCAVVMVYQTYTLIIQQPVNIYFAAFVFFSTVCSYNFHWFLTPHSVSPSQRLRWEMNHKIYHLLLATVGAAGSLVFFFFLKQHWFYIAVGKTIFLAMTWTYVTAVLPLLTEEHLFTQREFLFAAAQFFFIYSVCILFDFRDREDDKADGIRSMITYFNERGIDILFSISLTAFAVLCLLLQRQGLPWVTILFCSGWFGYVIRVIIMAGEQVLTIFETIKSDYGKSCC
jgi:hypothetical protein